MGAFNNRLGAWARGIVRSVIHLYYRRIEITGAEKIPHAGPVLFVANHANSLIDPVIIGIAAQRPVHFLAKAPLFDLPLLGNLMRALGMLPAYRGRDDRSQVQRNTESLSAAAAFLVKNEAVGIFPEGKSHDELRVEQVRSGASRIAMQALQDGVKNLRIVPLGLNYERKERFRSTLWVRVGEPIEAAAWLAEHGGEEKQSMRGLTEEIDRRLQAVVIHLNEAAWQPILADLEVLAPAKGAVKRNPIAALRQRKWLADGINHFMAQETVRAQSIAQEIQQHRERLTKIGLEMDSPVVRMRGVPATWHVVRESLRLAIGFIPAVTGSLHHLVPFLVIRLLTGRLSPPGKMTIALARLGIGLPVFAIWYALVWFWATQYFLPWVAWVWTFLMPFAGIHTLAYWRRARALTTTIRHEMRALTQRRQLVELRQAQKDLSAKLAGLAEDYGRVQPQPVPENTPSAFWWWTRRLAGWGLVTAVSVAIVLALPGWWERSFGERYSIAGPALHKLPPEVLTAQLDADEPALLGILNGLSDLETRAFKTREEFSSGQRNFYRQADNDAVRQLLLSYLNHRTALLRLVWKYQNHASIHEPKAALRAFLLETTAAAAVYDASLKFVTQFDGSPETLKKLNEPEPLWNIPPGLYDTVKRNLRQPENQQIAAAARRQYEARSQQFDAEGLRSAVPYEAFHAAIHRSMETARKLEPQLFSQLHPDLVADATSAGKQKVYEVKTFVSTWIGDTKIRAPREGHALISQRELDTLRKKLQPGDILIERRNWYLSNAFLPGYWPHAALYVGTADDIKKLGLDTDPRVQKRLAEFKQRDPEGHELVIIESVSEGVIFNTMEHSIGGGDSAAVLRPRLSTEQKREAIARAFSHVGKPYDFEFDFFTTDKLVCTELVFRSYDGPINFPLVDILGTRTMPAIELVRKYVTERGKAEAQLEFIAFIDGDETGGKAKFADEAAFMDTLDRPALTWLQGVNLK